MHRLQSRIGALLAAGALLTPPAAAEAQQGSGDAPPPRMFETSDQCIACHNGVVTPSGQDVSIGSDWRASMMANSSRDPYWQASVRREALAHPTASGPIQDECSTCHMPMARYRAHVSGREGRIFPHLPAMRGGAGAPAPTRAGRLAADGVSCAMCHQIQPDRLGSEESFVGGFVVDSVTPAGDRTVFGPFAVDSGRTRLMHSASKFRPRQSAHVQSSELCATCHTLYTHTLDDRGNVIGELPEQVPYLEWRHSDYPGEESCQSCHMPVVEDPVPVTGVMGQPRDSVNRHVFRGGNFFMLRMLNRYRNQLGVTAQPQELAGAARRTVDHLETRAARLILEETRLRDGRLEAELRVRNQAGHKLPTAYPSRRAWLHVTIRDRGGRVVFESGALRADGSIAGNANDADADRYERHHTEISDPDQVQIYEAIMADPEGEVTTGLLEAIRFVKDNRVLPRGFDKEEAEEDIAVQGAAMEDRDFTGSGDRIRYSVDLGDAPGPYRVEAELWYQPIAFRWARNLLQQDAPEIDRFVSWYDSMSASSATILARTATPVGARRAP